MDIEEIKCALCSQVYNDSERMPILLPDCGHSFCYSCIQGCFELLQQEQLQNKEETKCQLLSEIDDQACPLQNSKDEQLLPLVKEDELPEIIEQEAKDGNATLKQANRKSSEVESCEATFIQDRVETLGIEEEKLNEEVKGDLENDIISKPENVEKDGKSVNIDPIKAPIKSDASLKKVPLLFRCPEDDIQCSIQNPDSLPKNYALLKIVQRTLESEADRNKNIVILKYQQDSQKFIATKKEDKSLARFLTSGEGQTPDKKEVLHINQEVSASPSPIKNAQTEGRIQQQEIIKKPLLQPNSNIPSLKIKQPISSSQKNSNAQQPISNEPNVGLCKQHGRPQELICVMDKQRVCAQCALFGSHKGHDVRQEEDVTKEIQLKVEVLKDMEEAMNQQSNDLSQSHIYDKHYSLFKKRQQEIKGQIQEKFKEWRKQIRAVEMKLIDSLYINYGQFEEKFVQALNQNKRMINDCQSWMDNAKQQLDEYQSKTVQDPHYIAYNMLDCNEALDILNHGEQILERNEKQKGFPSLNGMEQQYNQVKVIFEPNFDKRLVNLAHIIGYGAASSQHAENSGDFTTASQSFLPQLSFTNEDEGNGANNALTMLPGALNISNISFNEPTSPINDRVVVSSQNQIEQQTASFTGHHQISNQHYDKARVTLQNNSIEEVKYGGSHSGSQENSHDEGSFQSKLVKTSQKDQTNLSLSNSQVQSQQVMNTSSGAASAGKGISTGATGTLRRVSMIKTPQMIQQANQQLVPSGQGPDTSLQQQIPQKVSGLLQHITIGLQPSGNPQQNSNLPPPGAQIPKKKADLATIFKTQASPLGELDLSNKNFSDMHAADLAKCLKQNSGHLKSLCLAKNRLTDEGLAQVIRALCDTQIEHVDLQGNKISEKSVDAIVGCLKTNKSLKVLDLSNNGIGSRLMKNKLKNALPHIEILL